MPPKPAAPSALGLSMFHAGANNKGGFPFFADGDVVITSPTGKRWKLHSLVLSQASFKLRQIFASTAPIEITNKMRNEGKTIQWKLEMVREPLADGCDPKSIKFKKFVAMDSNSRPALQLPANFNGSGDEPGFNDVYDNFFRCVYNISPNYGKQDTRDPNKNDYITAVTELLQAASYLEAVAAIRINIEAHLLRMSQVLWTHIARKPEGWVHIAGMLQSDIIFNECMVHIVGRFHLKERGIDKNFLSAPMHGEMGTVIWEVIQTKAAQLKALKLTVERNLLEFYPLRMIHSDEETIMPGRAVYTNDIYLWQALTLVRQYISSAFHSHYHHRASDGGLALYRSLGTADPAYLNAITMERFHVSFDMSGKGRKCLAEAVEQIKKDVTKVMAPLLVNCAQNETFEDMPWDHLTCCKVVEEELPWNILTQRQNEKAEADLDAEMGY